MWKRIIRVFLVIFIHLPLFLSCDLSVFIRRKQEAETKTTLKFFVRLLWEKNWLCDVAASEATVKNVSGLLK